MAKETVRVKIPLTRGDEEKEDVYVAVNGKTFQIKRGVYVDVPKSVAEVLEHSEEMQAVAIAYEATAKAKANQI